MEYRYLFKAKRIDNGEWVQGYLVYDNRDKLYRIIMEIQYSTGTCITTDNAPRVDSSTICQCTGLKDKNGKLIWENDIVNAVSSNSVGEPIYVDGIVVKVTDYNLMLNLYYSDELECVGNKFDNPELLRKRGII